MLLATYQGRIRNGSKVSDVIHRLNRVHICPSPQLGVVLLVKHTLDLLHSEVRVTIDRAIGGGSSATGSDIICVAGQVDVPSNHDTTATTRNMM